jgi:hypothetical protein
MVVKAGSAVHLVSDLSDEVRYFATTVLLSGRGRNSWAYKFFPALRQILLAEGV